jgi:Fur family zinc uptake transcriptional regulator
MTDALAPASLKIETTLAAIEASCAERGLALTPLRRRVLELLLEAGGPVKAYDLLAALKPDGSAQPPTVYRALDFLTKAGLAHKVEALNAYTACSHGDHADQHADDTAALFICGACGSVEERHVPRVSGDGAPEGFALERSVIEHYGRCADCPKG